MARLPQCRSHLTLEQIAKGMTLALKNAERLAKDAKLLLKSGSVPSSVALAILSIEESGKVAILRQMATAVEDKEWTELWKAYRTHTKKNTLWIFGELVKSGARTLDDFRPIANSDSDHPGTLDHLKQIAIYTDCFKDAHWSIPIEVNFEAMAPYLVQMAQVLGRAKTVSVEEILLWRKHLLPAKNSPLEQQKEAVSAWFKEMRLSGLSSSSQKDVDDFLKGFDKDMHL